MTTAIIGIVSKYVYDLKRNKQTEQKTEEQTTEKKEDKATQQIMETQKTLNDDIVD